eukprot:Tbor_TRINITY_DN3405_c0_g1::TRINITY_DN3405_c0_g1_i1::g.3744::m.3744
MPMDSKNRLNYLYLSLISHVVNVDLADGRTIEGVFTGHTHNDQGEEAILLHHARTLYKQGTPPKGSVEVFSICRLMFKDVVSIDVPVSSGLQFFSSATANGTSVDGGVRPIFEPQKRVVQTITSWADYNDDDNDMLDETSHTVGSWDQFSCNEKYFGVKSTFDEEKYTTKLVRENKTAAELQQSERIALEIERSTTKNIHHALDRGDNPKLMKDLEDDATLYSDVYRREAPLPPPPQAAKTATISSAGKYLPPSKRNLIDQQNGPNYTPTDTSKSIPSANSPIRNPPAPIEAIGGKGSATPATSTTNTTPNPSKSVSAADGSDSQPSDSKQATTANQADKKGPAAAAPTPNQQPALSAFSKPVSKDPSKVPPAATAITANGTPPAVPAAAPATKGHMLRYNAPPFCPAISTGVDAVAVSLGGGPALPRVNPLLPIKDHFPATQLPLPGVSLAHDNRLETYHDKNDMLNKNVFGFMKSIWRHALTSEGVSTMPPHSKSLLRSMVPISPPIHQADRPLHPHHQHHHHYKHQFTPPGVMPHNPPGATYHHHHHQHQHAFHRPDIHQYHNQPQYNNHSNMNTGMPRGSGNYMPSNNNNINNHHMSSISSAQSQGGPGHHMAMQHHQGDNHYMHGGVGHHHQHNMPHMPHNNNNNNNMSMNSQQPYNNNQGQYQDMHLNTRDGAIYASSNNVRGDGFTHSAQFSEPSRGSSTTPIPTGPRHTPGRGRGRGASGARAPPSVDAGDGKGPHGGGHTPRESSAEKKDPPPPVSRARATMTRGGKH